MVTLQAEKSMSRLHFFVERAFCMDSHHIFTLINIFVPFKVRCLKGSLKFKTPNP